MDPAELPRDVVMQLTSELGEERMRLFRSNCELLERGEMEMGRLRPSLLPDAVKGLMMPEARGDGYSRPSRENMELGRLVRSCEMELGVPERLAKSGDTMPAYCGDGPTPLRDRVKPPSADSCDLLSPLGRGGSAGSLFRRCWPTLSPSLGLSRSVTAAEPPSVLESPAPPRVEAHCVRSSFKVSFSMAKKKENLASVKTLQGVLSLPYLYKRKKIYDKSSTHTYTKS